MSTAYLDATPTSIVAACPCCQWRVVSADPVWVRRVFLEHLNVSFHPREETKIIRDSLRRYLVRNGIHVEPASSGSRRP